MIYYICYHSRFAKTLGTIVITNTDKPTYTKHIDFQVPCEIINEPEAKDIGNGFTPHTYMKADGKLVIKKDGSVIIK